MAHNYLVCLVSAGQLSAVLDAATCSVHDLGTVACIVAGVLAATVGSAETIELAVMKVDGAHAPDCSPQGLKLASRIPS
jgi:hypothetical protein